MTYGDQNSVLNHIKEGMDVYDVNGDKVGSVEYVQFGNEDLSQPGAESATVGATNPDREDTLVENIAEAIAPPDKLPKVVRDRLLRYGYIKVDPGILQSDHYVTPDLIAGVDDDGVKLNTTLGATPEA